MGAVMRLAMDTVDGISLEIEHLEAGKQDEARVAALRKWQRRSEARARLSAMVELAAALLPVRQDDLNAGKEGKHMLNCANGVLDLRTSKLAPHKKSHLFTYCTGVDYRANADKSEVLAFLNSVVDGERLDYLQRCIGYSLTGETNEEVMFYLYGPARSGKGTLTGMIASILGKPLAAGVDPANIDPDDDAAWGRLRVISLPESHLGSEDKHLKERLQAPETLAGFLAWAVEGARMYYQRGLPLPDAIKRDTNAARDEVDEVGQFIEECLVVCEDGFIENAQLYATYEAWCEMNGVTAKHKRGLTQSLKGKGLDAGKPTKVNGVTRRGLAGMTTA